MLESQPTSIVPWMEESPLELVAGPFLLVGIVAILVRFGPPIRVRLPDLVDRSIGMHVIRSIRGALDQGEPLDRAMGASPDAPLGREPLAAITDAAGTPAALSGLRRDLRATPARLAAIGVRRAQPTRRPAARGPITLAARSVPATRLAAAAPAPLWRRALTRLGRSERAPAIRTAPAGIPPRRSPGQPAPGSRVDPRRGVRVSPTTLATAATLGLVALVALAALVNEPPAVGGNPAATASPQASSVGRGGLAGASAGLWRRPVPSGSGEPSAAIPSAP